MGCWHCQSDPGIGAFCAACGKVQPLDPGATAFEVLGLASSPFVETMSLERRFHDLSRQVHPDRFAKASPRERRIAVERTTALNNAFRTLRDPASRAAYFLGLHGIRVDERASSSMSAEFLEEMLDCREALTRCRQSGDLTAARSMRDDFRRRAAALQAEIDDALSAWETSRDRALIEAAAEKLAAMRYVKRFLEEVDAMEMEAAP